MPKSVRVCFAGDVCGDLGVSVLLKLLPSVIKDNSIDFVFVNAENADNGSGINPHNASLLFSNGVDVITGGNHTLEKFNVRRAFAECDRILRPANYPVGVVGLGFVSIKKNGVDYTVMNLQGREGMRYHLDCPFRRSDEILSKVSSSIVLVDFHAESTQEKEALAFYLDGRCAFLGGTHTHIQTADARILLNGMAYITDVGMVGAFDSVIGGDSSIAIRRIKTQIREKIPMVLSGKTIFSAVLIDIDVLSKKAFSIKPLIITL
ncbi:MAG: TIGR00282 family metallophosphoesterase [Treponema sp.]